MESHNTSGVNFTYDELLSQNKTLSEELAKCQQDKDFVWKLWKELQVEHPSTTNMINSVIEREQEKSDAKDLKVLMIFEQKDKQLKILQEVSADLQTQVNLGNERISELLTQQADWKTKTKGYEDEKNVLKNELDYKDELLSTKDKQISLAEKSKKEIDNKRVELLQENSMYQKTIDTLNSKIEEACQQTEELNEKFISKYEEVKQLLTKLDHVEKEKEGGLDECEEYKSVIKKLKETIRNTNKDYDNINRNLEIRDEEVRNNKQLLRELSAEVDEQKEEILHLRDKQRGCENYSKQIKEQIEIIQSLECLQDETQNVLTQQEVTHQQEINLYQNTIFELKATIAKHEKESARILSENKTYKINNDRLESTCDAFRERENTLQQEIVSISLELESLKNKLRKADIKEKINVDERRYIDKNASMLTTCTQTTPSKHRYIYNESATQTEADSSSFDSEINASLKVKKKKEKLHTEAQRLLTLKSEMNQENRTLKKRLLVLENECSQLRKANIVIQNNAKQLQENNKKFKDELVDTLQKLQVTSDLLHERSKQLVDCQQELQVVSTSQVKESMLSKSTSSKLKSAEEELQVATTNCSKLSFQLKTLCGENEILTEKQKGFQERITKLDGILKQKKTYIEELKTKYNEANNASLKKSETIENINAKLKTVTDRENKDKIYIEKLKARQDILVKEKSDLQESLGALKTETDSKTRLLQETQRICHQAESAITAMEYTASQEIKREQMSFEHKEAELIRHYEKSVNRLNELQLFVKNFCEALLLQVHEKQRNILKKQKEKRPEGGEKKFQTAAYDVACSILNMSLGDLEEFMKDDGVSPCGKYEDNDIREKLDVILSKNDNFEKILTQFLLDLVEYYWTLCAEENE